MKKIKSKLLFGIILVIAMFSKSVNAQEIYYQNDLGVTLSKQEYEYISNMYWEGYQEYLTLDDYNEFKNNDLFNKPVEKVTKEIVDVPLTRGTSVTSNLRTLTIAKSCSDTCVLSLVTKWNGTPTIKSYDVFGARVTGVSTTNIKNALVSGDNYGKTYSNPKSYSNGFGYSVLVPNVGNVKTSVTFITTKGGTLYGSYQHAMRNTTEAVSRQYTIGLGGYGRVFNFTGSALNIYDNAPGVDIQV